MFHHDANHSGVATDPATGATAAAAGLTLKWRTALGSKIESSPAVVYNATLGKTLVYIQTWSNRLVALDAATGSIVWSYAEPGGKGADSSPAVYGNTVYIGATFGHTLWAVDATTGSPVCSYKVSGRIVAAPVVADLGNGPEVFFGDTGLSETDNYGSEWAITGVGNPLGPCKLVWSFNGWGDTNNRTYPGSWSPPALAYDSNQRPILVMGSSQPDSSIYALDARNGAEIWRYQTATFGDLDVGAGATITAPGVNGFGDGEVYIPGKNQVMYALDLMTGAVTWQFRMSKMIHVYVNSVSTPAVVGNAVFVAYGYGMWQFNATTGSVIWYTGTAAPVGGMILSSPAIGGAIGDQAVYSNDTAGGITAYSEASGASLWHDTIAQPFYSSDAVSDGMVFTGGMDGAVYAFGP